jgi:hypothetical protein
MLVEQLTLYAQSDYNYPMHDGRVLDGGKKWELYILQEKKEGRNQLTQTKSQTLKERNKSCICLMHQRGDKSIIHML